MHLLMGALLSVLMIALPLAYLSSIPAPPENLTGWLLFVLALGGVFTLIRVFVTKTVLVPAIETAIKAAVADIPTRSEFNLHIKDDKELKDKVEGFIQNYYEGTGTEHRHSARRKGDPQ